MKLEEVLPALKDGYRITRKSFTPSISFGINDDSDYVMILKVEDVTADDWQIVHKTVTITLKDLADAYTRAGSKIRNSYNSPGAADIALELGLFNKNNDN